MGLLSVIRKQKRRDREVRVLVLGLDNAGKTTIVRRLLGDDEAAVRRTAPTEGFCIRTLVLKGGYRFHFWDIGGQRALRSYWRNYFERTDAVIWVVDATTPHRIKGEAAQELAALLSEPSLYQVPLLIIANKMDLLAAEPVSSVRKALGIDAFCVAGAAATIATATIATPTSRRTPLEANQQTASDTMASTWAQAWPADELSQLDGRRPIHVMPCSAYTGEGLSNALDWLAQQAIQRLYRFDTRGDLRSSPSCVLSEQQHSVAL